MRLSVANWKSRDETSSQGYWLIIAEFARILRLNKKYSAKFYYKIHGQFIYFFDHSVFQLWTKIAFEVLKFSVKWTKTVESRIVFLSGCQLSILLIPPKLTEQFSRGSRKSSRFNWKRSHLVYTSALLS